MPSIEIDLQGNKDARELDANSLIHREEFSEAIGLIDKGIDVAKGLKNFRDNVHVHEAITIQGTRGSGKTTFLLSLRKHYRKVDVVEVLNVIDPTVIEEKGHIFLNVISMVDELVMQKLTDNASEPSVDQDENANTRKRWVKYRLDLADGLPSLDGIGGNINESDWQDAEYIMEKGMRSVGAARNLELNFRRFVFEALQILGKDVFLLSFDDIDIDFKKGWSILETIRKYFLTPKIITLISGDLRLYSLGIRKQYWKSFEVSIIENEGKGLNRLKLFNDRITEMESQYMLKVIKPERRVNLTTIYEKINIANLKGEYKISPINIRIGPGTEEIQTYYTNLIFEFGIRNQYQADTYSSFLLSLPLRTQLQFLSSFDFNFRGKQNANVIDAFMSDLLEKNINIGLLTGSSQLLNVEILRLLLREKVLNELYQLQPVTDDVHLNSSLLALTLFSSLKIDSNPYLIFDYFIKIGYVRNLLNILPYEDNIQKVAKVNPSIEGLCQHSGVYQNKVLRDIASNITAYLKGILPNNLAAGIIALPGLGQTRKKAESEIIDRIDIVFKYAGKDERILGFMPLSISAYTTKQRTIPCYSVFVLLAAIGELIRKAQLDDLDRGLAELSEVRTYAIPQFGERINEQFGSEPFSFDHENAASFGEDTLKYELENWVRRYRYVGYKPAAHLLGKIATRFFYALNSIENVDNSTNLGDMMHKRIIALFNAILIEEVRENIKDIKGFNLNNTGLKDDIFIQNLIVAEQHQEVLEFSKWMISCPILLLYLKLDDRLWERLAGFLQFNEEEKNIYFNKSIYDLLGKVSVRNDTAKTTYSSDIETYENWISNLKERNIPFEWFEVTTDRKRVRENNIKIRTELADIFGLNPIPRLIRNFRKYLQSNNIRW